MARNVEVKARVEDLEKLSAVVAAAADQGPFEIRQDDTFFPCESGRLKLRDFGDGRGELIFYQRANELDPKASFYIVSVTSMPTELRESLLLAYGCVGRVVKRRSLYLVGRTRVHLDRVEGLGDFVELEVVLGNDETVECGEVEARQLMSRFGIGKEQLVGGAYVDLVEDGTPGRGAINGVTVASRTASD